MRQAEEEPGTRTGYKVKIVESTGTNLDNMIILSMAMTVISQESGCLIYQTKTKTMKNLDKKCSKRKSNLRDMVQNMRGKGNRTDPSK